VAAAAVVAAEPPTSKRSKFNKQNAVPVKEEAAAPPKKEHPEAKPAATKTKEDGGGGGGGGSGGSGSGGGGGGSFGTFVFLAGVLGIAYAFRSKLRVALADYFPDKGAGGAGGAKGGKPKRKQARAPPPAASSASSCYLAQTPPSHACPRDTPPPPPSLPAPPAPPALLHPCTPFPPARAAPLAQEYKREYKSVGIRDDDTASQTSCGIPEQEIDAATEEWAARIAMQRSGAAPGDGAGCTTLAAGGLPGGGGCGGCGGGGGGGAAAGFASPGGAGLPPGMTTPQPSAPPAQEDFGGFGGFDGDGGGGAGGWGAGGGGTPMVGQQGLDGGMGGGGFGGPSQAGASDIDWGMLAEPTAAVGGGRGEDKDDPFSVQEPQEDDDDFIAFGGFGHDGKPTTKPDAKGAASGMSWDDERKMWNQASTSNPFASNPFGRRGGGGGGGGGGGSPWDLRSNLGTPTSLKDFRRQAEKVFNDNVSASLFASPSMQRFKRQSDDFFSGVTTSLSDTFSSLATITGVSSVTTGVNSYFKSWFG